MAYIKKKTDDGEFALYTHLNPVYIPNLILTIQYVENSKIEDMKNEDFVNKLKQDNDEVERSNKKLVLMNGILTYVNKASSILKRRKIVFKGKEELEKKQKIQKMSVRERADNFILKDLSSITDKDSLDQSEFIRKTKEFFEKKKKENGPNFFEKLRNKRDDHTIEDLKNNPELLKKIKKKKRKKRKETEENREDKVEQSQTPSKKKKSKKKKKISRNSIASVESSKLSESSRDLSKKKKRSIRSKKREEKKEKLCISSDKIIRVNKIEDLEDLKTPQPRHSLFNNYNMNNLNNKEYFDYLLNNFKKNINQDIEENKEENQNPKVEEDEEDDPSLGDSLFTRIQKKREKYEKEKEKLKKDEEEKKRLEEFRKEKTRFLKKKEKPKIIKASINFSIKFPETPKIKSTLVKKRNSQLFKSVNLKRAHLLKPKFGESSEKNLLLNDQKNIAFKNKKIRSLKRFSKTTTDNKIHTLGNISDKKRKVKKKNRSTSILRKENPKAKEIKENEDNENFKIMDDPDFIRNDNSWDEF